MKRTEKLVCSRQTSVINALGMIAVIVIASAVYGAIPFYSVPTMGQAIWVSSFARSISNDGWHLFAHNFGYPQPAPMAFGLPGALVEGAVLRMTNLRPVDAYSVMTIIFLALASWGAVRFTRQIGLSYRTSLVAATVWLTTPMIWGHANYSLLSIGIALLPFYLSMAMQVCRIDKTDFSVLASATTFFAATAVLSAFVDGYTFVMFALATGILLARKGVANRSRLVWVSIVNVPICAFGFALAYVLYTFFVGRVAFPTESLDFFRGFGADVTMLMFPSKGLFWFWDYVGLGLNRNDAYYFGDASVWMTTFSLLIVLFAWIGIFFLKRQKYLVSLLLIAIVGTYLSLGPSLKVHSLRPHEDIVAGRFSALMPANDAVAPTGSAFLWQHVPGITNMRASYRWMALGLFGFWAIFALLLGELDRRGRIGIALTLAIAAVLCDLPKHGVTMPGTVLDASHSSVKLRAPHHWRQSLIQLDASLLVSFEGAIPRRSVVAFVPGGNDFLANYLAAEANVKTYNVGGDKNTELATASWPANIRSLFSNGPEHLPVEIEKVLAAHNVDYVVIPFIDLLWDAHEWPPSPDRVAATKRRFEGVLAQMAANPNLVVDRYPYFATVRNRNW